MKGKLDIRFEFLSNQKLKSRLTSSEGKDFTKTLKKAIEDSALEILNTNALTVRATIERKMKEAGFDLKKPVYQAHLDADNKIMLSCSFSTKENSAE